MSGPMLKCSAESLTKPSIVRDVVPADARLKKHPRFLNHPHQLSDRRRHGGKDIAGFLLRPAYIDPKTIFIGDGWGRFAGEGPPRSAERRVGKACVSPCSSRWLPHT